MKFICDFFQGNKKLLKKEDAKLIVAPRRINGLSMKELWRIYRDDESLKPYWPVYTSKGQPNRDYFFIIFASILPKKYEELLDSVDEVRLERMEENNKALVLDDAIVQNYLKLHDKYNFIQCKRIKRLITKKK